MKQCIYCGTDKDLSISHIIPDALTNAYLTNRTVCKTEHNSKFSDEFESKVIKSFAYIANVIGVKSKKAVNYARYDALIEINSVLYQAKRMVANATLFNGHTLVSENAESRTILKKYDVDQCGTKNFGKKVDINCLPIEKTVVFETSSFFTIEMYRLMTKIAFEWYCLKNGIEEYHTEFKNIIDFITTGKDECPVQVIVNKSLYEDLHNFCNTPGSHLLFSFNDDEGNIIIVIAFFNIIMYRVVLSKQQFSFCHNNFLFQELRIDGTQRDYDNFATYEDVVRKKNDCLLKLANPTLETSLLTKTKVGKIPLSFELCIAKETDLYVNELTYFTILIEDLKQKDEEKNYKADEFLELLRNNIEKNLARSYIHIKSLKRFVKEHLLLEKEIKLNLKNSNPHDYYFYYIIMRIGEDQPKDIGNELLHCYNKELVFNKANEIILDTETETIIKAEFCKRDDIYKLLRKGAEIINQA